LSSRVKRYGVSFPEEALFSKHPQCLGEDLACACTTCECVTVQRAPALLLRAPLFTCALGWDIARGGFIRGGGILNTLLRIWVVCVFAYLVLCYADGDNHFETLKLSVGSGIESKLFDQSERPIQNQKKRCTRYTSREVILSTNHSTVYKKD